jgi:hypothetical protein
MATVLTTITVVNTSNATVAANAIPPTFGHVFKEGDVPSGTWPQFQMTSGGTQVPCTIYQANYWPDGSWRQASFIIRVPVSIAANSSVSINVMNGGSAPASGTRSTSDLTAGGLNLQTKVGGQFNLTGTWNSILAHGISNTNQSNSGAGADILTYGTGPVGNVYRIRASLEQSGSPHGGLETYWYCVVLEDSSNNLYGIRFLPLMTQPWYDTTVTKDFVAFNTLQLYNGSTLLLDLLAGTNPAFGVGQTFTASSGNANLTCSSGSLSSLLGTFGSYQGTNLFCMVSNSGGALPGGLFTNQAYWAQNTGSTTQFQITNTMGSGTVTPSSAGTGTQTVTPYPYLVWGGSEAFAQSNGMYNYIQGAGSVATDAPLRIQYNRQYWAQSGMIPPYLSTLTPTATPNPVPTKIWNIIYPFNAFQGAEGGRPDIGLYTAYSANHVWTQSANDEQTVRVLALEGMTESYWLRSATYRTIPICNNNTYSGCPPANPNFQWDGSNASGITNPPSTGVGTATEQVWTGNDFSHKPEFVGYAYQLTGEVDKLDHLMNLVSGALMNLYPGPSTPPGTGIAVANGTYNSMGAVRNSTVNGTAYYGHLTCGQQGRASAWSIRYAYMAKALCGAHPENANYAQYASDIAGATIGAWNNFLQDVCPTFLSTNGWFNIWDNSAGTSWQVWGYLLSSLCLGYGMTKDSATLSFVNYMMKWPATWYGTWGGMYTFPYYLQLTKIGEEANAAPAITSLGQVGISDLNPNVITWTTAGFTFAQNMTGNVYYPQNGDSFIFNVATPGIYFVPGGFTQGVQYYVVNAIGTGVGTTFKLSATKGGSPINPTDSGNTAAWIQPNTPQVATGFLMGNGGTENYSTIIPTAMRYADFIGATISAAMYNDLQTRFNYYDVDFTPEAQWDFSTTQGLTLSAAVGTFALTGEAITANSKRSLSVAEGAFSLTGETVSFFAPHQYGISAAKGAFALTGESVTFSAKRSLAVAHASFALTGEPITFGPHYSLSLAQGSFSFTGEAVTFPPKMISLPAATGNFAFTGEPVTLNRRVGGVSVSAGRFALKGGIVSFRLVRGPGLAPPFNWDQSWSYSPWINRYVDYVGYNAIERNMLVAYRTGLQQIYVNVSQGQVAQLNNILQRGGNPAAYLSTLKKMT